MKIEIITIFPKLFENFLKESLIARAQKKKLLSIHSHDLRHWTTDSHKTVDDRPYGGGAGMLLMVGPIARAVKAIKQKKSRKIKIVSLSAKGIPFTQSTARKYSKLDQLILICGRYEGIDERINKFIVDEEISIGPYVTFGGEIPAMVVIESVCRLIPGVVAKKESVKNESFSEHHSRDQLSIVREHPHYTRPEIIEIDGRVRRVPKVLLSGDHKKIENWRDKHQKKQLQ